MASFEVGGDDGSVFLLAGGIPDVQFGRFLVQGYIFHFEVDGGNLGIFLGEEITLGKTPEESCFADIAITYDDYFVFFLIFVDGEVAVLYHNFVGRVVMLLLLIWIFVLTKSIRNSHTTSC